MWGTCIDWVNEFVEEHTDVIKPFVKTIQSYYLHQHVFEPTRFRDGQEPNVLDLVFSNEEDMINILMQNPGLGDSDHTCINFDLNCYAKDDDRIKMPNYFKANYKTIRERLSAVNWTSELDADFITGYINFIRILELSM